MNKLEEYCLSRDIGWCIGWNKNNDYYVEIINKYGESFNILTDGHISKKKARKKALKLLKKKLKENNGRNLCRRLRYR